MASINPHVETSKTKQNKTTQKTKRIPPRPLQDHRDVAPKHPYHRCSWLKDSPLRACLRRNKEREREGRREGGRKEGGEEGRKGEKERKKELCVCVCVYGLCLM